MQVASQLIFWSMLNVWFIHVYEINRFPFKVDFCITRMAFYCLLFPQTNCPRNLWTWCAPCKHITLMHWIKKQQIIVINSMRVVESYCMRQPYSWLFLGINIGTIFIHFQVQVHKTSGGGGLWYCRPTQRLWNWGTCGGEEDQGCGTH